MEQVATRTHAVGGHASRLRFGGLGAWVLGFAPIVLLAIEGGGYDTVVYAQAGIAVWWLLLLGVLVGAFRPAVPSRRATAAVLVLGALAAWTWIGVGGSESGERTLAEAGRIITYLGVFVLALTTLDRTRVPAVIAGVASAIALVALLAVLSRLQPELFPHNETGAFLPTAVARLNWPLNYWNGLAALCALGVPLALGLASAHSRVAVRALAAAAIPVLALCIELTLSRGGIAAAAIGTVALLVLTPSPLRLLVTLAISGSGTALLLAAASQRDGVGHDLAGSAAFQQGDQLTAVLAVVVAGTALVQLGAALLEPTLAPRTRTFHFSAARRGASLATVALLASVGFAIASPDRVSHAWDRFTSIDSGVQATGVDRLSSLSSSGRYQLWTAAADAMDAHPVTGTGPGTFEFTWLRDASFEGTVKDAHSFYFELGAEGGVPALLLGVVLVIVLLSAGWGIGRAAPRSRPWLATAVAGISVFTVSAGVDWVWELPVIPVALMVLAAAAFTCGREPASSDGAKPRVRILTAVLALVPIALLVVVLASSSLVADSQASARAGDLKAALRQAVDAHVVDPRAATPLLQSSLVRERAGDLTGATADARMATEKEPMNWRTWLVLSRLAARTGQAEASVDAYRRARALNPGHPVFQP